VHICSGLVRVDLEFSSQGTRAEIKVKLRKDETTTKQSCFFFQAYRAISDNSADYASGDSLTA
jgi:hypothetical protein